MDELSISEIQIFPVKPKNGLIAFASCVINSSLFLGNIAVYTSPASYEGYRLVYPSKILPNGKEINCVHPINKLAGEIISKAILQKYQELISSVSLRREKHKMLS
jgi:DNA-binding cell septation regulator SpoVG